jgi:protein-disulfide isomerase
MTNNGEGLSKNQRREHARELARQNRLIEEKRRRRRTWIIQGSIGFGLIAVIVAVVLIIVSSTRPTTATADGPLNMQSDGALISADGGDITTVTTGAILAGEEPVATVPVDDDGVADIVVYVDYLCPFCGQFETTNGEQIEALVAEGAATLEIHPLSFLDSASRNTEYSTRAANAVACVANFDPDSVLAVNTALFANQPEENTTALDDDALKSLISAAGADSESITTCIDDRTFGDWVAEATDRALEGPLPNADIDSVAGTPTVLVNGAQYNGALDDPDAFAAFVADAIAG